MTKRELELSLGRGVISLRGGDPRGGDPLHRQVSKWPGWRRTRGKAVLASGATSSIYEAPLYPSTAVPILRIIEAEGALVEPNDLARIRGTAISIERAKIALDHPPESQEYSPNRVLYPHQRAGVEAARLMGYRCIIADDMGLGKTTTALSCFAQSSATRILVVCPASVKLNWRDEARQFLGEDAMIHVIDGTPKKRAKVLREMEEFADDGGVAIVNYDLLPGMMDGSLAFWTMGQMVVLDESHYIKNKDTKRTKWVRENLCCASFRMCLTGTPIRNRIDDLYTQADFVRPGVWTSYSDFCRRYLVEVRMELGDRTVVVPRGTKNHAELNKIINTFQIRRMKDDAIDLPPKVHTKTELELDPKTRKVYNAMKEFALLELAELPDDEQLFSPKAANGLGAALRCEQIAQGLVGGIPDEYLEKVLPLLEGVAERIPGRDGELILPGSTKIKWVIERAEDVLAQGGGPVIMSKFNGPLYWLHQYFEGRFGLITGRMSAEQRHDVTEGFRTGRLDGVLCQVKISEGFNLTRSQDVIFLGRDESPGINSQAEDRAHRIGTTGTVNIQIPVVARTVEVALDKRLGLKADEAELAIRNLTVGQLREIL